MGGWVGADESTANYDDIITNMYKGHQWVSEEFGVAPRIGWSIDSFGHSEVTASLFHDFGFEAHIFARMNDKEQ